MWKTTLPLLLVVAGSSAAWAFEAACICRYCEATAARMGFGVDLENDGPHYPPIREVDVTHIKLDITPNFEAQTVGGTTTIRFVPLREPVKKLRLDAVELNITRVEGSAAVVEYASTKHELTIAFEEPIPVGQESWVEIDHHCQPTGGFYFRTPEMGYPAEDTHCWTQGEAHYARQWFPCFDYPNERSTTEVVCHVPSDMTVISNGRMLGESVNPETRLKSVHWLQDKPHVNYLICVVAGYFHKLEDMAGQIPLGFYSQPTLAEHAPAAFQDTAPIMTFFQKEIGMAYPWHKYDQVTIRDFIAGGMENTSLTTLTHKTIYGEVSENIRSSRHLDAHELAHQWFGDYVTCEDWSHLWLNEGFATYYTHLYEGEKFGRDAMLYRLYGDAQKRILTQDKDKRPIVWDRYKNAREQFDYRAYPKGAWVLHMLRDELGEDLYRQAVKTYLDRYALTSVTTPDLQRTIEAVSGRTFDRFFDQWVYHGRFPDLKIRYRFDPATSLAHVSIEQTHNVDDEVRLFAFPAKFAFHCAGEVIEHTALVDEKKHEFYVRLPGKPSLVRFDPEYTLLARIDFEKPETMWLAQLNQDPSAIGRILAVEALAKKKSSEVIAALGQAVAEDKFFGVRVEAAEALGKMTSDEAWQMLAKIETPRDARVRLALAEALGRGYRPEHLDRFVDLSRQEKNPAIKAAWLRSLAKYSDPAVRDRLREALEEESFRNEVAEAAVDAMRETQNGQFAADLAAIVETGANQFTTEGVCSLLKSLAILSVDKPQKEVALRRISPYLHDARGAVKRSAIVALGELRMPETRPILQAFAEDEADDQLTEAAGDALAKITQSEKAQPDELIELRREMQQLQDANRTLREKMNDLEKRIQASPRPE